MLRKTPLPARHVDRAMPNRFLAPTCLLLFLSTGCDLTGEYDKKVQASLQSAGQRAVFDLNLHPNFTEVVDSAKQNVSVKLRIPKVFDANSKLLPIEKTQTALKLPGLSYALERQLDDDNGQFLPAFLFIAVRPKTEMKTDALQAELLAAVKASYPSGAWADVNLPTPNGQTVAFKRIREEGKPKMPAGGKKAVEVELREDTYLIDAGANNVVIIWHTPKPQAQKYNLEAAIEAAMGTLENTAPPAGPGGKAAPPGKAATGCF
jgi:hypothetical protein